MARKDFGSRPFTYPQPVYMVATYDENGRADAMPAAWAGISGHTEIMLSLTPKHKTCDNFLKTGAFTVSLADAKHVTECDYLGVVSAKNEPDKLAKAGFTVTKSRLVNAPVINELPICLECTVKSYDPETDHLFGEIVNVSVDESVLTDGKVDAAKACPITFDPFNNTYLVLGGKVGNAFSDGHKLQ